MFFRLCRIKEEKLAGTKIIDVDGSYLYRKYHQHPGVTIPSPSLPLTGWETVTEANHTEISTKIPKVTHGTYDTVCMMSSCTFQLLLSIGVLYTYLAEGVGNTNGKGAFRALQRGFIHWSSGRIDHLEVNYKHPTFCHVKCQTTPSMKPGIYQVYILLDSSGDFASISVATCQCAAG